MRRLRQSVIASVLGILLAALPASAFHEHEGPPSDLVSCDGCSLFLVTVRVSEVGAADSLVYANHRLGTRYLLQTPRRTRAIAFSSEGWSLPRTT